MSGEQEQRLLRGTMLLDQRVKSFDGFRRWLFQPFQICRWQWIIFEFPLGLWFDPPPHNGFGWRSGWC